MTNQSEDDRPTAEEREAILEWHSLFGLLLTDWFTDTPFTVELERDLSQQQQFLDVLIVRRGRGRLVGRLPDGLEGLLPHNLLTFKSHREALDAWAMKELVSHYVPYRKFVSDSPSDMLPEEQFRLYAVAARFPQQLSKQVPWHRIGDGVYDCVWGTDVVRVVVAGELPPEPHNAMLHLFSASADLLNFARTAYKQRSANTSLLLRRLFDNAQGEGMSMVYTMEDFKRDYFKRYFPLLSVEEQGEVLCVLPPDRRQELLNSLAPEERLAGLAPEERLAGLAPEEIRAYLDRMTSESSKKSRKPRRKK